ncbi:MAG TPA: twin-arginine translocase subunit TatC [Dissulfurispiraceae bacterium]|nr:twin-arginine translocase subunit TatC [Dissulfurispiraceae bacterium]
MSDEKQPLTQHLKELRKRILFSLIFILGIFFVTFSFAEDLFRFVMFPMKYRLDFALPIKLHLDFSQKIFGIVSQDMFVRFTPQEKLHGLKLVFLAPAEAFWMSMKVSFVAALFLSMPMLFYQLWSFIRPGLHQNERKYVVPFVCVATLLFLFGAAFCFILVLPFALEFLLTYNVGDFLTPMLSVGQFVDFSLKFILAFGIVFELPLIMIFLVKLGLVKPETLAKNRKFAHVLSFVVAAFLTPTPDMFNQMLMAVPMILLYELGIWIVPFFRKKPSDGGTQEL